MTAPRVDLVKIRKGILAEWEAARSPEFDEQPRRLSYRMTFVQALALADLIEKAKAFLDRVVHLQPKINSCTQISELHGCNPFGMRDNWAYERDALAALFEEKP